jgi:Protein of unknown function (DUF3096)
LCDEIAGFGSPAPSPGAHAGYSGGRMTITAAHLTPILSILFGALILIVPRFLNYFVAVYLILAGLLGLGVLRF